MFRSSTIIRELALNLDKVIFMLKHSVKLRRYLLCGCVAACVFIKFHTTFYRTTLLEISFLHFRNASLIHTLAQLAVKSHVLMLSS